MEVREALTRYAALHLLTMKTNWLPVHWNISDARGELESLLARVQYVAFGRICDEDLKIWKDCVLEEERIEPLAEGGLFWSINYVYKHLNRAWNGRNASMKTVDWRERHDVSRWERFPTHAIFRDLRTKPSRRRNNRTFLFSPSPIDATAIHPYLQFAWRKLVHLCELVKAAADASTTEGTSKESRKPAPLTEAEFGRRLHRIYAELNYVWHIRKPGSDRAADLSRATLRRLNCFPRGFA